MRFVVRKFMAAVMALAAAAISAQPYPSKPIRIVTSNPGGSNDIISRIIAQALAVRLGQNVIVDNRVGFVIMEIVSHARPDGYTLLLHANLLWISPLLEKAPYDTVRDFSPIAIATSSPNVLVVAPALQVKSVQDLIALAKAKPGVLNYASTGVGGSIHLAAELFKAIAGVNIVRIGYNGAAPGLNAVMSGEVQLTFGASASVSQLVKAGRLNALAVTSAAPSALMPGVPTIAASGLPGYEFVGMTGIFAPAQTSAAIINRLNQEIVQVLSQPDVKAKLFSAGADAIGSSPQQLDSTVKSDIIKLGKVIKDAGIKAD